MNEINAAEYGFLNSVIETSEIICNPEYRKYCEDNLCGNYNKNYACPPYCGTTQEMEDRIREYKKALVLQTKYKVKDALDPVVTKELKKEHNKKTRELLKLYQKETGQDCRVIMAGPCSLCGRCKMQENQPCPMQQDRFSCLSAYCIDVVKLAKAATLEISWDLDQASFFSIILYND